MSVGYGYSGSVSGGDETFHENLKKMTRRTGVREGVTETIAHNFETLSLDLYIRQIIYYLNGTRSLILFGLVF